MDAPKRVDLATAENLLKLSSGLKVELHPEEVVLACQLYVREHFPAMRIGYLLSPVQIPAPVIFTADPTE